LSPSPLIILFPNWFLWGCLFNLANVWLGFHLVYLLGSSSFVNSLMVSKKFASLLVVLPLPLFFYKRL
jgi:hypothetical protein